MNKGGGFYADLLQELAKSGVEVTALAPSDAEEEEGMQVEGIVKVIRVKSDNFRGDIGILKKGFAMLTLQSKYKNAIKKHLNGEQFDYVLLPTPPASLVNLALYVKKEMGAKMYVVLRDIHPECFNRRHIDSAIMNRTDVYDECKKPYGISPLIYKFMYLKSQKLYKHADAIGCMTPANMEYLSKIAPYVDKKKILLLPNWYTSSAMTGFDEVTLRERYGLTNKYIAIFGGTIGAAQAVWNIASLAKHFLNKKDVVFLVVGRGPKKQTLKNMVAKDSLTNVIFLDYMPREDYEAILNLADVGLISIDEKYPVPTSPSKVIGYMAMGKPVVAMFNKGNDYGEFYLDAASCGLWSVDLDHRKMFANFQKLYEDKMLREQMGRAGRKYYEEHFTSKRVSELLLKQLEEIIKYG